MYIKICVQRPTRVKKHMPGERVVAVDVAVAVGVAVAVDVDGA